MASRATYDEDEDEAPPLTKAELAEMRPAREVHKPKEFAALTSVRKRGRPISPNAKVKVTIRIDPETVAAFKATGPGWQTRIDGLLKRAAPKEGRTLWLHRDPTTGLLVGRKKLREKAAQEAEMKARSTKASA